MARTVTMHPRMVMKAFEAFSQDLDAALAMKQSDARITTSAVRLAKSCLDDLSNEIVKFVVEREKRPKASRLPLRWKYAELMSRSRVEATLADVLRVTNLDETLLNAA